MRTRFNRLAHEAALLVFSLLFAVVGALAWTANLGRDLWKFVSRSRVRRRSSTARKLGSPSGVVAELHGSHPASG